MILFFGDGRLGNQIFQYAFIRTAVKKKYTIISYNFEDILELFEDLPKVINIQNKLYKFLIRSYVLPLLDFFARIKLITSYKVDSNLENGYVTEAVTYTKTNGFLPILYFYPCFAQSEVFFNKDLVKYFILKENYLARAEKFLALIPNHFNKVFVHVRRGDYINHSVLGKRGVTLPISYFKNGIKWYENNIDNPFFVFLTDDPEYIENSFGDIQNKVISKNFMFVDFAIITMCEYGIMSNSSFSWWAAYMMKSRKKVFSPRFWLGWKSEIEIPKGITSNFADVLEVKINKSEVYSDL